MEQDVAIRVENLSKVYELQSNDHKEGDNKLWALNNISFEVKRGESIGIIGPNGSGKSTLLRVLSGITKPSSGKVKIRGKVASILDIGAGFHPELSGKENVFLNAQIYGFSFKEIQRKYDDIVRFSGIEKFINEPVKNYSNGMYLRLAFSIMAHFDFDIYLFDEIMNVGDAEFELTTKKIIQGLKSQGKTMILVSHDIKEIENQETYLILDSGILKRWTNDKKALNEYVIEEIDKTDYTIMQEPIKINDFSSFAEVDGFEVCSVELKHDDDSKCFVTNKEFVLEVEYENQSIEGYIDLMVFISDFRDNILMTAASFLSEEIDYIQGESRVRYRCVLPDNIFSSQIYSISIFFIFSETPLKDRLLKGEKVDSKNLKEDIYSLFENRILSLDNVIMFKPKLIYNNKEIDMGKLNLRGAFLPILKWEKHVKK